MTRVEALDLLESYVEYCRDASLKPKLEEAIKVLDRMRQEMNSQEACTNLLDCTKG